MIALSAARTLRKMFSSVLARSLPLRMKPRSCFNRSASGMKIGISLTVDSGVIVLPNEARKALWAEVSARSLGVIEVRDGVAV